MLCRVKPEDMEKLLNLRLHVIRKNLEYLAQIKWELVFCQIMLHIALVYGIYLQFTLRVKILTIFWGKSLLILLLIAVK